MSINQKGFANIVLIAVIVAIIAIGGYFVWSKKSQQPSNEPVSTTANWKTYTNTKLGYEIKLPSAWKVGDANASRVSLNSSENWGTFIKQEEWIKSGYTIDRPADPQENLIIAYSSDIIKYASNAGLKLTSPSSLEEFVKLIKTGDINPKKISFAGQTAYRVNTTGMFDEETIFLQRNNQIYSINIGSKIGMDAQLSDMILSTFKFTESNSKVNTKATHPVLQQVEKTVIDFLNARKQRDFNQAKPFLTLELANTIDPVEFAGVSNPHISRFEIVKSTFLPYGESCLVETKIYYEYTGQGETGSVINRYYVTCNPEGTTKYLIEAFPYVPPVNTASMIPVKVFFEKNELQTFSVTRYIPQTSQVAKATLEILLLGLSDAEMDNGYFTELPIGSKLKSLSIVDGEARPDFTGRIQAGGGSSSMGVRVEQITKTLLQFPTVKTVKISVEGSSNDTFQP